MSRLSAAVLAVLDEVWPAPTGGGQPAVWVSPQHQFGRPCVIGTRVPVETVVEQLLHGLSFDEVADDYDLDRDAVVATAVVAALNPWMLPRRRKVAPAWERWARQTGPAWHHGDWAAVAEPPTSEEIG